ncbi:MAG: hypothetical protein IJJ64_01975 [Butyrivibrio sp.]|nr:hypothetical protein [Butyrivibrio sp.]
MNKNNLCKMFCGAMLISMIFGAFTRTVDKRLEAESLAKTKEAEVVNEIITDDYIDVVKTDFELEDMLPNS